MLTEEGLEFVSARHLATLTTLRADGSPHVAPVGFTYDATAGLARVITSGASQKAVNVRRRAQMAICQFDGPRWLTLEGLGEVSEDPAEVADAVSRYGQRYRTPRENPTRLVLILRVTRVLGTAGFKLPQA